jgi:hypothetical protein
MPAGGVLVAEEYEMHPTPACGLENPDSTQPGSGALVSLLDRQALALDHTRLAAGLSAGEPGRSSPLMSRYGMAQSPSP